MRKTRVRLHGEGRARRKAQRGSASGSAARRCVRRERVCLLRRWTAHIACHGEADRRAVSRVACDRSHAHRAASRALCRRRTHSSSRIRRPAETVATITGQLAPPAALAMRSSRAQRLDEPTRLRRAQAPAWPVSCARRQLFRRQTGAR
eukprot:1681920-Prymnesium_polylepis.1